MSTSIVLLAYKEADNLRDLLPKIHKAAKEIGDKYEIIVVDSAKPLDDTKEVCKENDATYIPQKEPGYAGAFRTGIEAVNMENMMVLDADGSHDPADIGRIHKLFYSGFDMVIGSRYTKGGKSNDSKASFVMSKILNFVMRICIGVKAKDISTSYRLYDAKQIKAVTLKRHNYDVLQEVILRMKLNNRSFKIGEVPINFEKRNLGESKRRTLIFIGGYISSVFYLTFLRISASFKRNKSK